MCVVFPGASPTRAKFFRCKRRLITEDFPTLDRPAKAICGSRACGQSFKLAAECTNSTLCKFIVAPTVEFRCCGFYFAPAPRPAVPPGAPAPGRTLRVRAE